MAYEPPNGYDVFNLGNSQSISLDEMVSLIEEAMGKRAIRRYTDQAVGDMAVTCADTTKARKMLGYHPAVAIADGIPRYVAWALQQNFGGPAKRSVEPAVLVA